MATLTARINVRVSWWVKPFIKLCAIADMIGFNVDVDKVKSVIMNNGIKCYVKGGRTR